MTEPDLTDLLAGELEKEELKDALRKAHQQIAQAKNKKQAVVDAAYEGAHDAVLAQGKLKPVTAPKLSTAKGKEEVSLWHLSDWQGAKLTTTYNSEVMKERVAKFVKQAASITEVQRKDHPVHDLTVALGGDMIEGLFNFPTQPYEIDATLFEQFVTVANLLVQTIRTALTFHRKVHVVAEWGNHGRIGNKSSAVPKSDNADRMTYELARALLKDEPRVTWQDCPEDIQRLEIGAYRALVIHGDEVGRQGFASPATIVQHVNKWRSGAYPWEFRDVYMGHYHTHSEWSMANGMGTVFQTGSTESDNKYALNSLASSAIPSQRLHFIDPRKGRVTAQYKVILQEENER